MAGRTAGSSFAAMAASAIECPFVRGASEEAVMVVGTGVKAGMEVEELILTRFGSGDVGVLVDMTFERLGGLWEKRCWGARGLGDALARVACARLACSLTT